MVPFRYLNLPLILGLFMTHLLAGEGINSDTNFYKSEWPIPGKIFEIDAFLPPINEPPTPDQMTVAVQACKYASNLPLLVMGRLPCQDCL